MAYLDLNGLKQVGQRVNALFVRQDKIANNLTTTSSGMVLDARQGKALQTAINGKVSMTTASVSLTTSGWSSGGDGYVQAVSVSGVTASNTVIVVAAPASHKMYANNLVYCNAQASGKLTFTATVKPTSNLTVNILILK